MLIGEVLRAVVARVDLGSHGSSIGAVATGRAEHWFLAAASVLAVLAAGSATARVMRRLTAGTVPELIVLLDESAAFYRRWPEDRLDDAPRQGLVDEMARCRRIVELLATPCRDGDPALQGPVDGLRAWMTLLDSRIERLPCRPSGAAYV